MFWTIITIDLKCEFYNSWFIMHLTLFCAHIDCRPLNPRTFRVYTTINKNILHFAVRLGPTETGLDFTESRNEKSDKTKGTFTRVLEVKPPVDSCICYLIYLWLAGPAHMTHGLLCKL